MSIRIKGILASALLLFMLQGCATLQLDKPVDELNKDGEAAFKKGDYDDAVTIWKRVKESYPSPEMSARTELNIAEAYFKDKKYMEAGAEYEGFRKMHPAHEKAPFALYRQAICHFNLIGKIDTDQTPVKNAITTLESYLKAYPGGEYAKEVRGKIEECRDKQLQYEIYVGKFYLHNESYPAAIGRFEAAVKAFPDLPRRAEALALLAKACQDSGDLQKSREAAERLQRDFPGYKDAAKAGKVVGKP